MRPDEQDVAQRFENLRERVQEVVDWGRILRSLAVSSDPITTRDFMVIGDALDTLGGRMGDDLNEIQLARRAS